MLRFDRMTLDQAAALAGETRMATAVWLRSQGYTVHDGKIGRITTVQDKEAWHYAVRSLAPYDRPCARCGAARACEHRGALAA